MLVGINSGSFNALFLRAGCGVLGVSPKVPGVSRINTFIIGLQYLGIHHVVYACFPDLYPEVPWLTNVTSADVEAPEEAEHFRRFTDQPFMLSPISAMRLLHTLDTRISKSAVDSKLVRNISYFGCFAEERRDTREAFEQWSLQRNAQ